MFDFPVTLTERDGVKTLTALNLDSETPVYSADSTHPNWEAIIVGLKTGNPKVWDLFDIVGGIMQRFQQVSERYAWNGSEVLFDGDPIEGPFADLLGRSLAEGNVDNYTALAKFGEKLAQNPSENSRQQAFRFLANHQFQITPDGDVVAYKSVTPSGRTDAQGREIYLSGFSSRVKGKPSGFVNGKPVPELSKIPQSIGDVVTMPRSEVVEDPNKSCDRGLHVATVNYWGGFRTGVLEVHVNPRDFVSVPNGEDAKARVCRYYVSRVAVEPDGQSVITDAPTYQWTGDVGYRA